MTTRHLSVEMLRQGRPISPGQHICRLKEPSLATLEFGATLSRDGKTVVAAEGGVAYVVGSRVGVFPAKLHVGELTKAHPAEVVGNLVVLGHVNPGALISATGSVGIRGSVDSAQITAHGSVVIKGQCSGTTITSGFDQARVKASVRRLSLLASEVDRLLGILDQLEQHPSFKRFDLVQNLRPLLEILLERNLAAFPPRIGMAYRECQEYLNLGGPLEELANTLFNQFMGRQIFAICRTDVERLDRLVAEAMQQLGSDLGQQERIYIGQTAAQSVLQAAGGVEIGRGGSHGSRIEAGHHVRVHGTLNGGTTKAGDRVQAEFICGRAVVEVGETGRIQADCIQTGTIVQVGEEAVRCSRGYAPALAYRDGEDLRIESAGEVALI